MAINNPPSIGMTTNASAPECDAQPLFTDCLSRVAIYNRRLYRLIEDTESVLGRIRGHTPMPGPEEKEKDCEDLPLADGFERELCRMDEAIDELGKKLSNLREFI